MTREEKMWKDVEQEHGKLSRRESFVALTAMEWADKTMLEKIYIWLESINTDNYMDSGIFQMSEMISDLKKSMEKEVV